MVIKDPSKNLQSPSSIPDSSMADQKHIIKDKDGKHITVVLRRDKRLKKSSRWGWEADGTISLRVPNRFPKRQIPRLLKQITEQLDKNIIKAKGRTDADLQERAESINNKYFGGRIEWRAIRWVANMNNRLGSCTNGGSTDGHIRISNKIKHWPQWVIDYVIAHELVHRLHPDHSKTFWDTLTQAYSKTERARGFIQGVGFVYGRPYKEDSD
ncbi:YgjP-like metallopeptidase domain-containing protein [Chloroflexota bacterium]